MSSFVPSIFRPDNSSPIEVSLPTTNDNSHKDNSSVNITTTNITKQEDTAPLNQNPKSSSFRSADNNNNNNNSNNMFQANNNSNRSNGRPLLSDRDKKIAWSVFAFAVVITAISLIAVSLKKLSPTEQGLQYTKRTKQLAEAAQTGGLHVGPPGFSFVKFPSTQITEDLPTSTCLSKDGLRIQYTVTFQYVLPANWLKPCVVKYRNYGRWADLVAIAGNSAIQHTCSEFIVTEFQNQRGAIQARMKENLQNTLEGPERDGAGGVYAQAISVNLRYIELPSRYTNAIAQKEEASQDIELAVNQRAQETTKARTELLSAQEEALKIIETAQNDANITLTKAQLEAQESLFALETEAAILVRAKESLGLSSEGLLAFMANRLYAQAPQLSVAAGEPAKMSRKDEL